MIGKLIDQLDFYVYDITIILLSFVRSQMLLNLANKCGPRSQCIVPGLRLLKRVWGIKQTENLYSGCPKYYLFYYFRIQALLLDSKDIFQLQISKLSHQNATPAHKLKQDWQTPELKLNLPEFVSLKLQLGKRSSRVPTETKISFHRKPGFETNSQKGYIFETWSKNGYNF